VSKITTWGPSGLTLLGILFVGLKLTNYITWSWWWVLLPFYGPAALALGIMIIVGFATVWSVPKKRG
jgi:hypothetical protein